MDDIQGIGPEWKTLELVWSKLAWLDCIPSINTQSTKEKANISTFKLVCGLSWIVCEIMKEVLGKGD